VVKWMKLQCLNKHLYWNKVEKCYSYALHRVPCYQRMFLCIMIIMKKSSSAEILIPSGLWQYQVWQTGTDISEPPPTVNRGNRFLQNVGSYFPTHPPEHMASHLKTDMWRKWDMVDSTVTRVRNKWLKECGTILLWS